MLVLSRKKHETIHIGEDIKIMVLEIRGDKVRLGIEAPRSVRIVRSELLEPSEASEVAEAAESTQAGPLSAYLKSPQ